MAVVMSATRVSNTLVRLECGEKVYYVETSEDLVGVFEDQALMSQIGAQLLSRPSQANLPLVAPYEYYLDEKGKPQLALPNLEFPAACPEESHDSNIESSKAHGPAKIDSPSSGGKATPAKKRQCVQPSPQAKSFLPVSGPESEDMTGLCYGLSACSPFKGNARRSLLSSSLLSGKYPAFSLCVNFEKIPAETFDEKHFVKLLKNRLRLQDGSVEDELEQVQLKDYDVILDTVTIELPSLKVFAVLIALGDYHYDGCELPISFPNDIHSHEVVFHGIPSDTYEDAHFLKVMRWKMKSVGKASAKDVDGISITHSDLPARSATVKFPSLQSLTALLRAGKFVYDGDELNMSFPEASVRDSDKTDNILDDSATHLPEEVPTLLTLGPDQEATYEETHFLKFLRKKLQDEDASLKPFLQGISVFLFDQEVQRLTVEMSSQACVKALKKIIEEGLTYGDDKLEVLLPDEYQADHDEKVPCKKSQGITSERSFSLDLEALDVDNYDDFQPGLEHCSESAADAEEDLIALQTGPDKYPVLPRGQTLRTDWPTHETLRLMQACLKNSKSLNHSSTQERGKGWRAVMVFMWERGLFYSLNNMKKKLKVLKEYLDGCEDDWPYRPLVEEFCGLEEEGSSDIQSLLQKYPRDQVPQKKKGRAAAVADNKALCRAVGPEEGEELKHIFNTKEKSLLLIAEYATRRHKFENSLDREAALFLEIRKVFHEKGYTSVTTDNLKKRMAYLKGRYHYYQDMGHLCTGSGVDYTSWEFYDVMGQLDEGKAAENPRKLVGIGSSTFTHTRPGRAACKDSDVSDSSSDEGSRKKKGVRRNEAHKTDRGKGITNSSRSIKKKKYIRTISLTPLKERKYRQGAAIQQSITKVASILEEHFGKSVIVKEEPQ